MRIFEILGIDVPGTFVFTSDARTGVPHSINIYDYLKDCFRDNMYVIFLFSRHFYDSNMCAAETGAAWATNNYHSNIVIDIGFGEVDKPIDNAQCGLAISDLDRLDRDEAIKFIKTVCTRVGFNVPGDAEIRQAIEKAIIGFRGRLNTNSFCPKRKYQGHPVCGNCGNTMDLKTDTGGLYYECRTPSCKKRINAEIY